MWAYTQTTKTIKEGLYTVIPQKASTPVNNKHKITKQLSKKSLAKRYLREKGIKDEVKTNLLIETLKKAESC